LNPIGDKGKSIKGGKSKDKGIKGVKIRVSNGIRICREGYIRVRIYGG
jgi:hypothetical protein